MAKTELVAIIQGNYGQGWEDVSSYPYGERQVNRSEALKNLRHDLGEYRASGHGTYRTIERREPLVE